MIEGLILVIAFVIGVVVGRWWALLALIALPLAYLRAGTDSDGTPQWMWAIVLLGPFAFLALLIGIVIGKAMRRQGRQSRWQSDR